MPENKNKAFKALLNSSSIPMAKIALKAGLNNMYIYALVNSSRIPKPDTLRKLSRASEIPLLKLYLSLGWCDESDIQEAIEEDLEGLTEIQRLQYIATRQALKKTIIDS